MQIALQNYKIKRVIKLSCDFGVIQSYCPKCGKDYPLECIVAIGEFNTRFYTVEKCPKCSENFLVIYEHFKKIKSGGKNG